ncbi:alkaline phosphatase D family protein [Gayadomonas joobiniege]|uniref:alkaline phosphatase D family protein n=1 Tax=Gayadomonas joobiniege TaxID=1234606 RepID=UPI00036A52AC|nr:alkaline phosphatase D family protein [Gayadomonas joobiniege]
MKNQISRRDALKFVAAGVAASTIVGCANSSSAQNGRQNRANLSPRQSLQDNWHKTHNRVFLGGQYWANPMEDWRIKDGAAECIYGGGNRTVHCLTHQLSEPEKGFEMSVLIEQKKTGLNDGGAGFRLGARSELNEYRSNAFVQTGLDMGIYKKQLVLADKAIQLKTTHSAYLLKLTAQPQAGAVTLVLEAFDESGIHLLASLSTLVAAAEVIGNVAITSNFKVPAKEHRNLKNSELGAIYRFKHWQLSGDGFDVKPEQTFGPILWTMYTLNNSRNEAGYILKLSAILAPMGDKDNQLVKLQVKKSGQWQTLSEQTIDRDPSLVTFKSENWDEKQNTEFRVLYQESHSDQTQSNHYYHGIIKANPVDRTLRMAALTCQNDYGFPYAPVAENVVKMDPDLVFFSGDQIYENHGGYGLIREPVDLGLLNYLRKYYQFGWAFKEAMRNAPTVCLPDDHDVLQGNLWGMGGAPMQNIEKDPTASILGGYIESVRIVNAVHKTCVGHHPDPFDPTPTPSGISSYYTDMVYGDVGFAILADRQWKSGPEALDIHVGVTGQGEDPLYINPDFDRADLELLGKRQEEFLAQWGRDWRGHNLKAVLSQTVFAGIATHQPRPDRYLKYDFDGSGWPATARNRAIDIMRESSALHICGDTHLGTLSQYGVKQQRDSNWAFCTPAISAGWPRWWLPDVAGLPHTNRPAHGLAQTGEYLDSFGNKIYVYAAANPEVGKSNNRYVKAHEKGSGFGFIEFDTKNLTYTLSAYRFLVDVKDGRSDNQFPGWPVTIHKDENRGKNRLS